MNQYSQKIIFVLRLALGVLFLYAGYSKLTSPNWVGGLSGYLKAAKTFPGLYAWLASPQNIGWVKFLNEWGLTLIGLSLLVGFLVRYASIAGIFVMVMYYLPILSFPIVGDHSFLVDEHIIYIIAFALFIATDAGKYFGLDGRLKFGRAK